MSLEENKKLALEAFLWEGKVVSSDRYGNGHINDTFLVQATSSYILQRLKETVFPQGAETMGNLIAVTLYLQKAIQEEKAKGYPTSQEALSLVMAQNGSYAYQDPDGSFWRAFKIHPNSETFEEPRTKDELYASGKAFGSFLYFLRDYPVKSLFVPLPHFHDTPYHYAEFMAARKTANPARLSTAEKEIHYLRLKKSFYPLIVAKLEKGELPLRLVHNDTKFNNLLFDKQTHEVLSVLDLDTVMPGSLLYDFGDGARSACNTAEENEKDPSKVSFSLSAFERFSKGYLVGIHDALSPEEYALLSESVLLLTLELALRFLGDYLSGDRYFAVSYPEENYIRARNQVLLAKDIEKKLPEMKQILKGEKCG